jgi:cytidylate kinase
LATLAAQPFWSVLLDWDRTKVRYRGLDITDDIYSEQTGQDASLVSRWPMVRTALLKAQRDCTNNTDYLIAEGRDCGTVVFPNADLKFYLTASATDRAERRAQETGTAVAEIKRSQTQRDERDSQRQVAPLQIPNDAQILDTTGLTFEQVMKVVEEIVVQRFGLTLLP